MSSNDTTTPTRPDLSVLKDNDPASPGVLCLDGAYLRQLVAWIEYLERDRWRLPLDRVNVIVEHLIMDGSRDGLILGDELNVAMGASARRRAEVGW